ncbi:MAG: YkgJ family cysteine cluster protein [Chitinophagales bacterium]|nr:YkgJ family cysteine cluster protein [Chitinophagales bacterium]
MAASPEYQLILQQIQEKARKEKKENRVLFKRLKKSKPIGFDKAFKYYHDVAFSNTNCLECSNCCRIAQPVFDMKDIRRLSKHLLIGPREFIKKYLKKDPTYEYLTKTTPCPFIGDDNKCQVYEFRPSGCRTYPPAKLRQTPEQLDVIHDNIGICPAINKMVEKIKERFSLKERLPFFISPALQEPVSVPVSIAASENS